MKKVELGDRVKDKVSGFNGVVVAITKFLTGCDRACIDPGCNKDGSMAEAQSIDVLTLEVIEKKAVVVKPPAKKEAKGGSYDLSKIKERY